jgi:hypothetical protein
MKSIASTASGTVTPTAIRTVELVCDWFVGLAVADVCVVDIDGAVEIKDVAVALEVGEIDSLVEEMVVSLASPVATPSLLRKTPAFSAQHSGSSSQQYEPSGQIFTRGRKPVSVAGLAVSMTFTHALHVHTVETDLGTGLQRPRIVCTGGSDDYSCIFVRAAESVRSALVCSLAA